MLVGLNIGNSHTKIYADHDRQAVFPSVVGDSHQPLFSVDGNIRKCMLDPDFVFGCTALEESRNPRRSSETPSWVTNDLWYALFLAGLSEVTKGNVTTNVVTGLPIGPAHQQHAPELKGRLLGVHRFKRAGNHLQTVVVENARVIPEPFGILLDLWLTDSAKVRDAAYRHGRYGVIDAGSNTINFMVVNDLSDVERESYTHEHGAWDVIRAARARLDHDLPGLDLRDHELETALVKGSVTCYGQEVSLLSLRKTLTLDPAREIMDIANRVFDIATLKGVVIGGGFSILLRDAIEKHDPWPQGFLRWADAPLLANARGFYKFARLLANAGQW